MRRSGLSGALKAHEEDDRCRVLSLQAELRGLIPTKKLDHLVIDDLRELLSGIDGLEDLLAQGLIEGRVDETADDAEIDIRIKESFLDFLYRIAYVLL